CFPVKSIRDTLSAAVILVAMLGCNDGGPVTPVEDPTAVVIGTAYLDRNDDGTYGGGDVEISGAHASLLMHASGDTLARTQSGANGTFVFTGLAAGTYRVVVNLGSMGDSLAVLSAGETPIVLAEGDTAVTEVRVGYSATAASVVGVRAMPIGQRVSVSGVALTDASVFGDSTLHLMDASGSIRVTDVREPVSAGDSVRLIARVAVRSGQPVLTAVTTSIVRSDVSIPAPDSVPTSRAAAAAGGVLDAAQVAVSGTIAAVAPDGSGVSQLTLDDGSGALIVELHPSAGFTSASHEVGQRVRARGVLVPAAGGSWHLRPREPSEVTVSAGVVSCSTAGLAGQFPCRGVDLVALLSIADLGGASGERLNDIWGWTDPVTGREYAIVGRSHGTSFVDISDPINARLVANLPKTAESSPSVWRDMKVYRNHVYVVSDGAGPHGMQVVDLTRLRQFAGTPLQLTPDAHYREIASAHNLVINEESGFAYAVGASSGGQTCGGGLHMIDIREEKAPRFAGCFADPQTGYGRGYTHDAQCVTYRGPDSRFTGREICFGANATALSIADVTDRSNPQALSRASYPDVSYSHQAWLTEDQRYLYMNDELDETSGRVMRTRTLIWDVADLEDPQLVAQYMGVEGSTDHNLYIRGNLMYQANYTSGLRILDITDREAPVELGFFDTMPGADMPGFQGAWSNYPFFDSGLIVVSSIHEGLFVLRRR
ncbi:MAG TPA: choice-of-anchor B family protein, partial [Longimicrobiales bacterium]|nr:choice-of-anchor B family protein [Longimicrobiales bacterium]